VRILIVEDEFKLADVIASRLRKEKIESNVIMLTAKSMLEDKLTGFNNGANDYVIKPFHIDELVARVNAQLRIDNVQIQKDYIESEKGITTFKVVLK
jgi:response regulator